MSTITGADKHEELPSDFRMTVALWPLLTASAVGLVPFTVFSTFLVPIAENADVGIATMGSLRGLGGLAALVVGTALAPLIDRLPKEWTAASALGMLGLSAVLGTAGDFVALAAFCLLVGAATAMLNPALSAAAADHYSSDAAAGRAATLVTATQSLTAMLAGPLVTIPALWWGWRGDLIAVTGISVLLGVLFLGRRKSGFVSHQRSERPGYVESFRMLAQIPGAVSLMFIAMLRTAAFMGYLSYLAAFYSERFSLSPTVFGFVWTLSGASFFLGNLVVGRIINSSRLRIRVEALLIAALAIVLVATVGFYAASALPMALVFTSFLGIGHATVAACLVSLLVRRCGRLRGSALSINAAGMSFGVFAGAGAGGIGLGLAGYLGTAVVFGGITLLALVAALFVHRGMRHRSDGASDRVRHA